MILGTISLSPEGMKEWAVQSREGASLARQDFFAGGIRIVAVAGEVDDWAAYAGQINCPPEDIAREGGKIGESTSRMLFGWLLHLNYRR